MKRLLILSLLCANMATAMVTDTRTKNELDFINAITKGDLVAVRNYLNAGFRVNEPFTITGFRGHTPLTVALMDKIPQFEVRNNTLQLKGMKDNSANKYVIAESLIAQGASKEQLNALLAEAVAQKNAQKALWLVKNSKLAVDSQLLSTIRRLANTESVANKILWTEVADRLEKPATQLPVAPVVSEEKKEEELFNALQKRDLAAVKKAIAMGASPKEFKHLTWMKDLTLQERQPFGWVPLDSKGYEILDYLLSVGADKQALNDLLLLAVNDGNKAEVEWILARKGNNPKALPLAQAKENEFKSKPQELAKYKAIRELLEKQK